MTYDPQKHHRRSLRLQNFDYSDEGPYFVTVCVHERRCFFGDVQASKMQLNEIGRMIEAEWHRLPERFPWLTLDEFIVMPNHLHGLVGLEGRGEACLRPSLDANSGEDKLRPYGTAPESLGRIVQA